ncbi:MAG: type 1 glutamine amidotransferase domain-containing protein [Aerococcus sp.]|nr:type 1 glutamine amidotransferase domain-containing protein [Aerococcus sp.]
MAKVAIVLADMFEDVELTSPKKALEDAGHETTIIGSKAGETVTGKTEGTEVTVEKAFKDVKPEDFDALLIPGGYSPDHLRADDDALAFVRGMFEDTKPTFSICHGPQLLVNADVLNGKTITAVKQVAVDVKNAGANFVDEEVVIDEPNKIVSSRTPADIPAFDKSIVEKLAEWNK